MCLLSCFGLNRSVQEVPMIDIIPPNGMVHPIRKQHNVSPEVMLQQDKLVSKKAKGILLKKDVQ